MLTMYMLVLAVLGMIMPSQAQSGNYSTSSLLADGSQLNITYLMREKVEFSVWVKRGYVLELDLGYSISNLDTIKFLDRWPFV